MKTYTVEVKIYTKGKVVETNMTTIKGVPPMAFSTTLAMLNYAKEQAYEVDGTWSLWIKENEDQALFRSTHSGSVEAAFTTIEHSFSVFMDVTAYEDQYLDNFIYV